MPSIFIIFQQIINYEYSLITKISLKKFTYHIKQSDLIVEIFQFKLILQNHSTAFGRNPCFCLLAYNTYHLSIPTSINTTWNKAENTRKKKQANTPSVCHSSCNFFRETLSPFSTERAMQFSIWFISLIVRLKSLIVWLKSLVVCLKSLVVGRESLIIWLKTLIVRLSSLRLNIVMCNRLILRWIGIVVNWRILIRLRVIPSWRLSNWRWRRYPLVVKEWFIGDIRIGIIVVHKNY